MVYTTATLTVMVTVMMMKTDFKTLNKQWYTAHQGTNPFHNFLF